MPFNKIFNLVGSEEKIVSCINFESEEISIAYFVLLTKESSFALIDLLSGKNIGTTLELDEFGCSILQELGNIYVVLF